MHFFHFTPESHFKWDSYWWFQFSRPFYLYRIFPSQFCEIFLSFFYSFVPYSQMLLWNFLLYFILFYFTFLPREKRKIYTQQEPKGKNVQKPTTKWREKRVGKSDKNRSKTLHGRSQYSKLKCLYFRKGMRFKLKIGKSCFWNNKEKAKNFFSMRWHSSARRLNV